MERQHSQEKRWGRIIGLTILVGGVLSGIYQAGLRGYRGMSGIAWKNCGKRCAKEAIEKHRFKELMQGTHEEDRDYLSNLTRQAKEGPSPCRIEAGETRPTESQLTEFVKGFESVVGRDY